MTSKELADYRSLFHARYGCFPSVPFEALPAEKRRELEAMAEPDDEPLPAQLKSPIKSGWHV